jgi:hypothetical protein
MADERETALFLRRIVGLALVFLLLALVPIGREQQFLFGVRAGALGGALIYSWVAAGTSIWAAIRFRQRRSYFMVPLCILVASAATAFGYYWIFIRFLQAASA